MMGRKEKVTKRLNIWPFVLSMLAGADDLLVLCNILLSYANDCAIIKISHIFFDIFFQRLKK